MGLRGQLKMEAVEKDMQVLITNGPRISKFCLFLDDYGSQFIRKRNSTLAKS